MTPSLSSRQQGFTSSAFSAPSPQSPQGPGAGMPVDQEMDEMAMEDGIPGVPTDMTDNPVFNASSQMATYRNALKRQALRGALSRVRKRVGGGVGADTPYSRDPYAGIEAREDGGPVKGYRNPDLHPHGSSRPSTRAPLSRPARSSGLARYYEDQSRLKFENAGRGNVDPVSGLSQTPTEAEINAQLAMLNSKPDEGIPGYSGFDQALIMADYFDAKRSGDPAALAAATAEVMDFKNKLNALRADKIKAAGGTPYVVNEKGTESFAPADGGKPTAIPGGEHVTSFTEDGEVIPAGRTSSLIRSGRIDGPDMSQPLGEGVLSRDDEGNANLGTGSVYNVGGGRRELLSKYGSGSSQRPIPPPPAPRERDGLDVARDRFEEDGYDGSIIGLHASPDREFSPNPAAKLWDDPRTPAEEAADFAKGMPAPARRSFSELTKTTPRAPTPPIMDAVNWTRDKLGQASSIKEGLRRAMPWNLGRDAMKYLLTPR